MPEQSPKTARVVDRAAQGAAERWDLLHAARLIDDYERRDTGRPVRTTAELIEEIEASRDE